MGYSTEFSGQIEIDKALKAKEVQEINDFSEERHENHSIGIWCNWVIDEEKNVIVWNEAEKFYNAAEWLKYVIDTFLANKGYVCNGEIDCQGEDSQDLWKIEVINNKVYTRKIVLKFSDKKEVIL